MEICNYISVIFVLINDFNSEHLSTCVYKCTCMYKITLDFLNGCRFTWPIQLIYIPPVVKNIPKQ